MFECEVRRKEHFTSPTEMGSTIYKKSKTVCVPVISKGRSAFAQDLILYDPFK